MGFLVYENRDVTTINCHLKTSMFNIVYGSPKNVNSSILQIKKEYKGQPFAWWIPPSQHNAIVTKTLIENGLVIDTIEHAMICDLHKVISFKYTTDLAIKEVINHSMLEDFISVLKPYDPHVSDFYNRFNDELLKGNEKLIVGYALGMPVSIGILFLCDQSAGIFSLITRERSQGKGYGTDMMVFLMETAKKHGCDSVTLSASSDSGYRIYERLGFAKVGEFECFEYKGNNSCHQF